MDIKIPVIRSSMPPFEKYVEKISGLWQSRHLTNAGALHEQLAKKLEGYLEADHVSLFTNGHLALQLGIQALELSGEVITTPFTFASTTQAIVQNGLKPVFCDIDPVRFTIDPSKIEALITQQTSAIVAVHVYGIPCDTDGIETIAKKHGLKVIYDAAHAFGVRYMDKPIAQYGDYSMFSFHATKVFHTVEGGGATYSDATLKAKLHSMRDFGLVGEDVAYVGTNAKMSEFHAAMGLCNLDEVDEAIAKRKAASERYDARLNGIRGLQLFPQIEGLVRSYSYYPVVISEEFGKDRDEVAAMLKEQGILARKYFYPLTSAFSSYQGQFAPGDTPVAQKIARQVLCLPMYADLTSKDIDTVCNALLAR